MDTALGEITLVLFTTLAPSGAVAFIGMGMAVLARTTEEALRQRIRVFMSIPIGVTMVGLVASATHLGNPANALYVFAGVGRSPLSNEVLFAVVFLALSGLYWLYAFSERPRPLMQRLWLAVAMAAGAAFVAAVAFAYDAQAIVSWNTVYVPLNLALNAMVGGPVLALAGLRAAGFEGRGRLKGSSLLALSAAALAANTACAGLQNAQLDTIVNSLTSASRLVPHYALMIAAFCALSLSGIGLDARALLARGRLKGRVGLSLPRAALAAFLVFVGIFIMRFAFYMMHMTAGLGV